MRKQDALELRARDMATAAGVDPDSRVPFKDGRTQPAWCTFRHEAQAERNALEQAKTNSNISPQPDQYKNAPWIAVGDHDPAAIDQLKTCMRVGNVVGGVLCADGHLGYAQPVGGVIAYENQISISGVGFDIGCGNMAVRLDTPFSAIENNVATLLQDIRTNISFGIGRANDTRVEHELFDDMDAWRASGMSDYKRKAVTQLGTVGSGNHYVDLFRDEDDFVWIGVHFGSRGLGHTTATRYLKLAGGKDGINVPPAVVDENSEVGQAYLAGMHLAGRYAYAGREWVVERVRQMIGGAVTKSVHNHHNFAWKEKHDGRSVWVVRKGATPAWPGQEGFVGGSMGENAVIVAGVDSAMSMSMLYSTVHGAGRLHGRKEAKRRFTREEMDDWLKASGVMLSGGDLDESPMAYKRLSEVLDHHKGTIEVRHVLKPFAVAMAGDGEFDPFKD